MQGHSDGGPDTDGSGLLNDLDEVDATYLTAVIISFSRRIVCISNVQTDRRPERGFMLIDAHGSRDSCTV